MARKALIEKAEKEKKYDVRDYNRCNICGRSRGYIRDFGICRVCFRELAHKGELPGVKKASW
ncbi:MAG: type Z 30S ribosomal protein S14 [Candidatus Bipolaricaulota bacterium]|nr:type Z 30S ribosomal protein S14 [Candidatus Bipolaricaulota bacterium]MBS3791238.1 type Z 30S ribosomal protein S14 [Candidatus Bipolaricaulota bacterium]